MGSELWFYPTELKSQLWLYTVIIWYWHLLIPISCFIEFFLNDCKKLLLTNDYKWQLVNVEGREIKYYHSKNVKPGKNVSKTTLSISSPYWYWSEILKLSWLLRCKQLEQLAEFGLNSKYELHYYSWAFSLGASVQQLYYRCVWDDATKGNFKKVFAQVRDAQDWANWRSKVAIVINMHD